jgi:hypothetical protein
LKLLPGRKAETALGFADDISGTVFEGDHSGCLTNAGGSVKEGFHRKSPESLTASPRAMFMEFTVWKIPVP